MPIDLEKRLVIGISTRALFDLDEEDKIFRSEGGLDAFREHQRLNEDELLRQGTAFPLVKGLLSLNDQVPNRIEVLIVSHNHPDVSVRVSNSISHYGLNITRKAFTGGTPTDRFVKYLKAYKVSLFLSADRADVTAANDNGIPSALVFNSPTTFVPSCEEIRIAFDGDCVLFNGDSEKLHSQYSLPYFHEYERQNARVPLSEGPFASLLRKLSELRKLIVGTPRIRLGLFTARNAPADERVIRTLRDQWNISFDEAHFLGGVGKDEILEVFQPHIFFDDQMAHCSAASSRVPTAQVLSTDGINAVSANKIAVQMEFTQDLESHFNKFTECCRDFVKDEYDEHRVEFEDWFRKHVASLPHSKALALVNELVTSHQQTPVGDQRRARSRENDKTAKLMKFLSGLANKHDRGV